MDKEIKPSNPFYKDDEQLGNDYCASVDCNACHGTVGESNEPTGYGCEAMDEFMVANCHMIIGEDGFYEYLEELLFY